jgi:hypothetical protein
MPGTHTNNININTNEMDNISSVNSNEIIKDELDKKCAPTLTFEDGSCIPLRLLVEMANAYNKTFSNDKDTIIMHAGVETLNPKKYKKYLLREFSIKYKDVCDDQRCWLKQEFMKQMESAYRKERVTQVFRPIGPNGRFTWLNTVDINKVMVQYEKKYKGFKFLGAVPIDFDDLPQLGIKNMNFYKLYGEGIDKIGIIYNLDEHYKSGSHWVAGFTNLKKGQIYYYDSYGTEPEPRIRKLMRRFAKAAKLTSNLSENKLDIRHNKVRHQYKNSECGVFSLSFILRLLQGKTFDDISNSGVKDEQINECRKVYFL